MKSIRELSVLILTIRGYPSPSPGASNVKAGEVYLWQKVITAAKKQILQLQENKKCACVLVIGQCARPTWRASSKDPPHTQRLTLNRRLCSSS